VCKYFLKFFWITGTLFQKCSGVQISKSVSDEHCLTAHELFDENDLAIFSSYLHQEVTNLKAMLHAIDIGTPIFCFSLLFCTCTYASCYRHYYLYKESFIMDDN
jgi:hypothetical protein